MLHICITDWSKIYVIILYIAKGLNILNLFVFIKFQNKLVMKT